MRFASSIFCFVIAAMFLLTPLEADIYLKSGTLITGEKKTMSIAGAQSKQGSGYYLVELNEAISDADKQAITDVGAEIIEYIPDNSFIVHLEHCRISALKLLSCVKWIGLYKAEYKSKDSFADYSGKKQFIVTLFPGQSENYLLGKAKLLGVSNIGCGNAGYGHMCKVIADNSQLAELANSDAVAWVEPYIQPKLCNNVAEGIMGVQDVREDIGLYGASQTVGVADNGLDTGDLSTISADFSGRISKTYCIRRSDAWSDLNGHGSHVTGSFVGSGILSGSNPSTHSYDNSFAGVAPEAKLVFQSIGDSSGMVFPPLHLGDLFQPVYDDGVRVHSDSWGSAVNSEYTVYSNEVDQFLWDHKDFSAIFAVGNDGVDNDQNGVIDTGNLYAPATAKNCISVGASENLRLSGGYQVGYGAAWPSDYPVYPIKNDLMSNNISGIAAFSGRGPTNDGRIKPDICAPGTNIVSCRTHASGQPSTGWGVYDSNYMYWGGTSMSTPLVAGSAALVREYYQTQKGITPSAALIKATLISSAVDMYPGQYGTGQYREVSNAPDFVQGWGRVNLKDSLYPDLPVVNEFADESSGLSTGESREYQYNVIDNSVPFKATLVWTDYPGSVLASKELVNDLDLTVISPSGTTYPLLGNVDRLNNVEQVKINSPEVGIYTVKISGYNVPMGPQDYALIVSGGLPSTYISGTVTNSSGAGVSGVIVTIGSTSEIKRVTTNISGKYVTHISPGEYSVQVNKAGWTFDPRGKVVDVSTSPVENVDFQGQGSPGTLSGNINSAVGGVVSYILESPHPYLNDSDNTYTITAHDGTTKMRVHFAEIALMNDGDTIYIMDSNNNIKNTYTGSAEDLWSSWVDGSTIKVRLVATPTGNIAYGFYVDGYETNLIDQGALEGAILTLLPGGYQTATQSDGSYAFASIPPGTYTVTPSKKSWVFQPNTKTVDVPAGAATSNNNFTGFPPGSVTGEIYKSSIISQDTDVESDHNYEDNLDQIWTITGNSDANRIRLHFSQLITEPAFDVVSILDGSGKNIETYTGSNTDLWTPWIDGNVAQIELTSDDGSNEWGFKCDKYECQIIGGILPGVKVSMSPDGLTATTSEQGTFTFNNVEVGTHTLTPFLDPWVFDPSPESISISAGVNQSLFFYASLGDLSNTVQAKNLDDGTQITLKGTVVSAAFNGFFYVQDVNRTGGMRVDSTVSVNVGNSVNITGTIETVDGERRLNASSVTIN